MRTIWKPQYQQDLIIPNCCQQALFPVLSEIVLRWNYDVDPRKEDDAPPTSSERMKVELFTKNDSRNTQVSIFSK